MIPEEELIQGCIKGDRQKQKHLFELYHRKMFVVCLRYTKNQLDAEDILQESFVKVFEHIGGFRKECPLEQWIKRIVVNTALKFLRKKRSLNEVEDVQELENSLPDEEFTLSAYHFKDLLKMIQKLPQKCQVIFNLVAIEGYQHNEVAEMLQINEGTSKSQYARAKLLLKNMITQNEERVYVTGF